MIRSTSSSLASQVGICRSVCTISFAIFTATSARSHSQPISSTPSLLRFRLNENLQTSAWCRPYLTIQKKNDYTTGIYQGSEAVPEAPQDMRPEPPPITPWYLQVDRLQHVTEPSPNRNRLPPLPENSPPLLEPVLQFMSTDLGLDALSILDLRKLDPPPGLGANLLMVLATSRSEKHLHVSASRFCKWLRGSHKLSPYADGLLGRGEIKLKLRRKARRAKLLRSVGSAEKADMDDGLSTGWICVNVGRIDSGENAIDPSPALENFVGFGRQVVGITFVVQMMTESKREELDLEELWANALVRHEKREARLSKLPSDMLEKLGLQSSETEPVSATESEGYEVEGYEREGHESEKNENEEIEGDENESEKYESENDSDENQSEQQLNHSSRPAHSFQRIISPRELREESDKW